MPLALYNLITMFTPMNRRRPLLREIIETVLLAVLVFVCLHISVQNYQVEGSSMFPTLDQGDCVLANKLVYSRIDVRKYQKYLPDTSFFEDDLIFPFHPPKMGEVIVFQYPQDLTRHFVKRIIGTPGDVVQLMKGKVYVNHKALSEPYVDRNEFTTDWGPYVIADGQYFVLGDNRPASNDSRAWGTISFDHIIGRYWFRYWPFLCELAPINKGNLK